jgi:glutathione-regulated potassium-efflux system protein KefB
VDELKAVAELGVVLFMFTVGLELRPEKVWALRRLIFGLGSAQMLVTAAVLAAYLVLLVRVPWESATIIGLAFSMSSTAIIMATLGERGELSSEHGRTIFAVLMAQDLWVVPVMALVPILAHSTSNAPAMHLWEKLALMAGALAGIFVIGRYLLPAALGYCAGRRQMDAFELVLFLAVIAAAWAVDKVGISMTLGAFLLGMTLSASDFRYQIEATVGPFKRILMGLFFIAVGMSIDVGALLRDWEALLVHVPVVLLLKIMVLLGLVAAFRMGRPAAIRTGFYLSQVGEFAFVLLGAASVAGLLSAEGDTLAMLVVAVSMIATPLMVEAGDRLAVRFQALPEHTEAKPAADLDRHVVILGYDEVGRLIDLMLTKANIPHIAFDRDLSAVRRGERSGRAVYFGNMFSSTTQEAAGLAKATAVFVTAHETEKAKALAVTLHRLYPHLEIHVVVRTLGDEQELVARGIRNARTGYIESTLARGGMLLANLGVPEQDVHELVEALRHDDYALIRADYAEAEPPGR